MFNELDKYQSDHFFLMPGGALMQSCNAPTDKSGVYLVYALEKGRVELIYIGRSGKKTADGNIQTRKAGCGGIKDRIVNGKHFNRLARRVCWLQQMKLENIDALDIYWYITYDDTYKDCPEEIEKLLLQKFTYIMGKPPRWNKKV
jgi:hypothetical protein